MRALVYLGANACIVGRDTQKTEKVAGELSKTRPGAKVIGIVAVDVRDVKSLRDAADRCVRDLGGIYFVIAGAAEIF